MMSIQCKAMYIHRQAERPLILVFRPAVSREKQGLSAKRRARSEACRKYGRVTGHLTDGRGRSSSSKVRDKGIRPLLSSVPP